MTGLTNHNRCLFIQILTGCFCVPITTSDMVDGGVCVCPSLFSGGSDYKLGSTALESPWGLPQDPCDMGQ